ncbi:MAG: protein-disulfide reductase DsbD family protein [Opitutales bacterium]
MRFSFPLFVWALGGLASALSAAPARDQHVAAELFAEVEALAPGQTFTAAVHLTHDPRWHTYWKSSTTGYATSIDWDLPAGFEAGAIQWPVPKTYEMGGLVEFVYEGEATLLVELTAPEDLTPGTEITLAATVGWLMCTDVCIPGEVEVRLTLPVVDDPRAVEPAHEALFAAARDALPISEAPYQARAWQSGEDIFLALEGDAGAPPGELYFFDEQVFLEPVMEQPQRPWGDQAVVLRFAIDSAGVGEVERLKGVLKTSASWLPETARDGWVLDLAWSEPPSGFAWAELGAPDTSAGSPATEDAPAGLFAVLGAAFLGGLILNLMPCVFPVLGIKIMGFVNQGGQERRKVVLHGLTFTAGVLASFWLLAAVLLILRAGGDELGWGFQLQNPIFVYLLAVFLFLFGLNMSGVFEVGTSAVGVGAGLTAKSGLSGSFFSGVLATVVATPCAAPFLAPALGAALALPPVTSIVVFTFIALGLAAPYLVLSAFPGLVKKLPRPGPWMETFKQAMAFLLYATAGYLFWVLVGQLVESQGYTPDALLWAIFGLILIAAAAWTYGRWSTPSRRAPVRRAGLIGALAIALVGLVLGYPDRAYDPVALAASDAPAVTWEKWEPGKAEALAAAGQLVYVDFTARWCTTCQVNKQAVFGSAEVRRFFAEHGVVALKADWTNQDPTIAAALAAYDRAAVPFNLIHAPGREPLVLPEVLTPGLVLDRLEEAAEG